MVANINRLFSESSTKLRYICNCYVIQCPQHVFVKSRRTFLQSDLDTVSQKLILPIQVLLLNTIE